MGKEIRYTIYDEDMKPIETNETEIVETELIETEWRQDEYEEKCSKEGIRQS